MTRLWIRLRSTGLAARWKRSGWPRWTGSTLSRNAKGLSLPSWVTRNRRIILALALWCSVGAFAQQPPANVATPVSTADASCGACHAEILRSYLSTPMANASGLAAERQKTGVFDHKASGMRYPLSVDGPKLMLTYRDENDPWI